MAAKLATPHTPVLEGEWVRLEPMRPSHLDALAGIAFDSEIWRYMISWVRTRDDLQAWMDESFALEAAGRAMPWVTVEKASGRIVGSTSFFDLALHHGTTELGQTWLAAHARGTPVNPEAKLLQMRYGFETLKLARVELRTHHENFRSQRAIAKLGAAYEGTFRNHFLMPDGTRRHSIYYSILDREWPGLKQRLTDRLALAAAPAPPS